MALIEKEAVIDIVNSQYCASCDETEKALGEIIEAVKALPTIECPMQFGGMCYVIPPDVDECRVFPTVDECWEKKKPSWCPLVEVFTRHEMLAGADVNTSKN